jgi:DNA-directed RNA polymerase specialized sigma24 family protein
LQDLEDCYSQATLELIDQARRGTLRCSSQAHLRNILEQRFISRMHDRRRALAGRSPGTAILDGAISLGVPGESQLEIADRRADVERHALLRFELRSLERASYVLSTDQRLVLCCQIMQMSRGDFCSRFGWSHEKYRKVAQRGRARLRSELSAAESCPGGPAASERAAGTDLSIAGLRLDTSHDGTDVGPNRDENGPRWRILGHIPTWAHWSVRHPPGL